MSEHMLPLGEVVRALRTEIIDAATFGKGETVRFEVGPIEVEFTVVAKREGGPNGKISFGILGIGAELGGSAKFSSEQTQKVKLSLTPHQKEEDGSVSQVEIRKKPKPEQNVASAEELLKRRP